MPTKKISIFSFTLPQLEEKCVALGLKKFNATQIFQWIYKQSVNSFDEMTNIAKSSVDVLKENFYFNNLKVVKQ
jgi:23S rRNA (adenine2503-C2)-methyltransferase